VDSFREKQKHVKAPLERVSKKEDVDVAPPFEQQQRNY